MRLLKRRPPEQSPQAVQQRRRPFPTAAVAAGLGAATLVAGGGSAFWLWHNGTLARTGHAIVTHAWAAGSRQGLALQNVDVVGRQRQSAASILAALGVQRGMPML